MPDNPVCPRFHSNGTVGQDERQLQKAEELIDILPEAGLPAQFLRPEGILCRYVKILVPGISTSERQLTPLSIVSYFEHKSDGRECH